MGATEQQQHVRGKPHPVLGYASKTAAAVALKAQGLSVHEIAERLDIEAKTVHAFLINRRRHSERKRIFGIEAGTLAKLEPHAARRGITVGELVQKIVRTVISDGLVDSVLDDQPSERRL